MTETLEIGLLGRIRFGDGNIDKLPKKSQALLAYLAANPGRAIPRDQLADLLWSTSGPEQARHSLRQGLAAVRRALGPDARDLIATVGTDVLLAADAVDVDLHRFETLAPSMASADLTAANALYRDEFLAGFDIASEPFMAWVGVERARLESMACGVLRRLAAVLSDAGEHDAAIAAAQRLVALDPLHEDGHRVLMQLYALVGRRVEAIRQFSTLSDNLRRELDVAPDQNTVAVARAIRAASSTPALLSAEDVADRNAIGSDAETGSGGPLHEVAEGAATIRPLETDRRTNGATIPGVLAVSAIAPHAVSAGTWRDANPSSWLRLLAALSLVGAFVTAAGAGIWYHALLRFDGEWTVQLVCETNPMARGYTFHFPAQVKDGLLHGERGIAGKPGWLEIEGPIGADGRAILKARGLTNEPSRTYYAVETGTPYGYTLEARFNGTNGHGKRIELRACSVSFTKI
jgi:DNA-binding SARP family transcriptional activator